MTARKRTTTPYRIEGDVAILSLTQGQETLIDVADLPRVLRHCWCAALDKGTGRFYALTSDRTDGKHQTIRLHRFILDAPEDTIVDHWDHDSLNNRRANLRLVTRSQNAQNRERAVRTSTTGVRGVGIQREKRGYTYYRAHVRMGDKMSVRLFPYTPAGLAEATKAVVQMRLELMTHSDGR